MTYQQITIVGNVGRDPELRYLQNGVAVCDFSVAVNKRFKTSGGEQRDETTWFRVTCWRQLAETVKQYVTKGKQVLIIGEIKATAYLDKAGQPASTLEITAETLKFLGGRGEGGSEGGGSGGAGGNRYDEFAPPGQMDDIPF
ncbi:MAG: single-stranded DNA-binding protein [Armatimonadetes bacterium]|nr:single-stranded DNA-binding protein [Anaerolineae bacterium]